MKTVISLFLVKHRNQISISVVLLLGYLVFFGARQEFKVENDFTILISKAGHPAVFTIMRVDPEKEDLVGNCEGQISKSHNESIFTAAEESDVLRRYRITNSHNFFGKVFWQDCYEIYMPLIAVSLYPDMSLWPFREDDIQPGDPVYEKISQLTKTNRDAIRNSP